MPGSADDGMRGRTDLVRILDGRPHEPALLAEIGGAVSIAVGAARDRTLTITPTAGSPEIVAAGTRVYSIPAWRYPHVRDGEIIAAGTPLLEGGVDPAAVARILGPEAAARVLVDRIQLVHAMSGVRLAVRHAEVVARALLRFVRVTAPGDGPFAAGELVDRARFARACEAVERSLGTPPAAEPTVAGLVRRASGRRPRRRRTPIVKASGWR